jgi:hypothetical protein
LIAGGASGAVILAGDPAHSRLVQAVRYTDPDLQMPPKGRLSREEVADLEAWVKLGAPMPHSVPSAPTPDRKHWAFDPVRDVLPPSVQHEALVQNPVDRFILAKLEPRGLSPATVADKRTLLRRVTYDLTGLPPTAQEVDAFLSDTPAGAYRRVVDRLLASPAYGERWGRHWLDLMRYTDDFDEAWRYRDWVVSAFNQDLPYDQFIIDQIAGDRLPAPTADTVNVDGIVATTMLSMGRWGGIDRKKRMADIVDDQIDTIGRSFLGVTLACARCHDHKFDPITTADYYGLAGIFYSTRVISDTVYLSHQTPRLQIPLVPATEVEKHRRHMERVQALEKTLETAVEQQYADFSRSLVPQTERYLMAAWDMEHPPAGESKPSAEDLAKERGLKLFALEQWANYLSGAPLGEFHLLHNRMSNYDGEPGVHAWGAHAERPWWGVNTNAHAVPIETWLLPSRTVAINPGVEGGAVGWKSPISGKVRIEGRLSDADPHDGVGVDWAVDLTTRTGRRELSSGRLPNGGSLTLADGRNPERLTSVEVRAGDEVYLQAWLHESDAHYDITNIELKITRVDGPEKWSLMQDALAHFLEGNPHGDALGNRAVWHYYDMAGSNRKLRMPALEPVLKRWRDLLMGAKDRAAVAKAAHELQAEIMKPGAASGYADALTGIRSPFWVNARDDAKYLSADAQPALTKLAQEVEALKNSAPSVPCANGAQDGGPRFSMFPGIQDACIHVRGRYEQLGPRIPRHFPRALAGDRQPPITSGSGRLELARWIASPANPLTARVMVNRIWQHHFGEGIVRTPSNFGKLGAAPTHPELLDWLARQFVATGWSVKAMHRLMVLSATYQQSSQPSPELLRADPDNLLFGRMNRKRLEAEDLRDSLLAVCDQLEQRPSGPADDSQSHRRMLYVKASRSHPSGFGALFDAADASIHVEKRTTSTVTPQALFLMNGPVVLEGIQHLLSRPGIASRQGEERVQALYSVVFGRKAAADEVALGRRFLSVLAAEPLQPVTDGAPPLTPWETYAQILLLSNEFLFVD